MSIQAQFPLQSATDCFTLHNGVTVPCLGFGVWLLEDGAQTADMVQSAIAQGYRHIDTAAFYHNEVGVGQAVRNCGVPREDIFVTSKLANPDRGYDSTLRAFDVTMDKLGLDVLDLYLIHWPAVWGAHPTQENLDTWRAMEEIYQSGRVRAIGVSNFLGHHLQPILDVCTVAPMVNQLEYNPGTQQTDAVTFCRAHDILVQAWSPLGRGRVLNDARLQAMAATYGVTVAQLCLRFALQNGVNPMAKSATPARIAQNLDVFGFHITDADMATLRSLPSFGGSGLHPDTKRD